MGRLASDLKNMGFERTERESPVDEAGTLWSNGYELVCDETGTIIDGNHHVAPDSDSDDHEMHCGELVFRYQTSKRVKLPGGYTGSYHWGESDGRFTY